MLPAESSFAPCARPRKPHHSHPPPAASDGASASAATVARGGRAALHRTHRLVVPTFVAALPSLLSSLPRFDAIVCLGCFPEQIATSSHVCEFLRRFARPYWLVIEYAKLEVGKFPRRARRVPFLQLAAGGGCGELGPCLALGRTSSVQLTIDTEPTGMFRERRMGYVWVSDDGAPPPPMARPAESCAAQDESATPPDAAVAAAAAAAAVTVAASPLAASGLAATASAKRAPPHRFFASRVSDIRTYAELAAEAEAIAARTRGFGKRDTSAAALDALYGESPAVKGWHDPLKRRASQDAPRPCWRAQQAPTTALPAAKPCRPIP